MKKFLVGKKKLVLIVGVVAAVAVGAAVAAWVLTSTGSPGRGAVGSVTAPTVTQAADSSGTECYPGQSCAMKVTVNNPNSNALVLTGVNYSGLGVQFEKTFGTADTNCPSANGTVNNLTGLNISIPTGTTTITIPGAWSLSSSAPTACMGDYVEFHDAGGDPATYTWSTS